MKVESHFTNKRFFEEDDAPKETTLTAITFIGKSALINALQVPKEDAPTHQLKKEESKQEDTSSSIKQVDQKVATTTGSAPRVLKHIPKS